MSFGARTRWAFPESLHAKTYTPLFRRKYRSGVSNWLISFAEKSHRGKSRSLPSTAPLASGLITILSRSPPLTTSQTISSVSGSRPNIIRTSGRYSSVTTFTGVPLTRSILSEGRKPAARAGLSGAVPETITPLVASKYMSRWKSRNGCSNRPLQDQLTLPCSRSCFIMTFADSAGIAKPKSATPMKVPSALMPTTSPWVLTSGPPELPGPMLASVCIHRTYSLWPSRYRRAQETVPNVRERLSPHGAPSAMTKEPSVSFVESPNSANGTVSPSFSLSLQSAMSMDLSEPRTSASKLRPSESMHLTDVALSTTCQLVMNSPSGEITNALPETVSAESLPLLVLSVMHCT